LAAVVPNPEEEPDDEADDVEDESLEPDEPDVVSAFFSELEPPGLPEPARLSVR
jgi:hypothetical protein